MKRAQGFACVCLAALLSGAFAAPAMAQSPQCAGVTGQVARNSSGVDGVLGIRRGMTLDEVRKVMACINPQYKLDAEVRSATQAYQMGNEPRVGEQKVTTLTYRKGLDKLFITMMGEPMHVTFMSMFVDFEFGGRTQENVLADLTANYGSFIGSQLQYDGETHQKGWCESVAGAAPVDQGCWSTISYKLWRSRITVTFNYLGDSGKHFRPAPADAAYLREIEAD